MTISSFRLSDYGVAEITWENGQPAMHRCGRTNETLESIVHHATTCYNKSQKQEFVLEESQNLARTHDISSNVASSGGKRVVNTSPSYIKKKPRPSAIIHDQCVRNLNLQEDKISNSKDKTWPSSDLYNKSLKSTKTDGDSSCQHGWENQEEECQNEGGTIRSRSSRPGRAAAIHNQSERRRREKINQKMKALQKLVPNANKTDKASMLDEVLDYIKTLQTQVQLMKNMPIAPPQMMIPVPLQFQQQQYLLQMSMLAQMGMGIGLQTAMQPPARHPFMVPQTMVSPAIAGPLSKQIHENLSSNTTDPFGDPHSAFLSQHMNTVMYNNMDAFYRQHVNQGNSMGMSSTQPHHVPGE